MKTQHYYWTATHERHTILLMEEELSENQRKARLTVDQLHQENIELPAWYLPGFAFGTEKLLIWCGTRVYVFTYETGQLLTFDVPDEVLTAYATADLWCLVCETSIALFASEFNKEISRFQHSEVILRSWWSRDTLIVEDFEKQRLAVAVNSHGLEVTHV
jgi:hypothetical protein